MKLLFVQFASAIFVSTPFFPAVHLVSAFCRQCLAGRAMAQAVSRRILTAEARVRFADPSGRAV